MEIEHKLAVVDASLAELAATALDGELVRETEDGYAPIGRLASAIRKLRHTEPSAVPVYPKTPYGEGRGATMVPAGYRGTTQLYRYVYLSAPLLGVEIDAVTKAHRYLEAVMA